MAHTVFQMGYPERRAERRWHTENPSVWILDRLHSSLPGIYGHFQVEIQHSEDMVSLKICPSIHLSHKKIENLT